jgi:hypothetical protein
LLYSFVDDDAKVQQSDQREHEEAHVEADRSQQPKASRLPEVEVEAHYADHQKGVTSSIHRDVCPAILSNEREQDREGAAHHGCDSAPPDKVR